MRPLYLFAFLIFAVNIHNLSAQETRRPLTVNFQQSTITQFVTDLESKTAYRFFFDPLDMDSLRITYKGEQKTLFNVLDEVFRNTNYQYAVGNNDIFLTRKNAIRTELATGYSSTGTATGQSELNNDRESQSANATDAISENKLYEIGIKTNELKSGNATVAGYLRDKRTGTPLSGAKINVPDLKRTVITNESGFYSLTLPRGAHSLHIQGLNLREGRRQVMLYSDGRMNIELQENVMSLKEVNISGEKLANVKSVEMGVNKLDIRAIKQVPTVFGEADVLRVVLTLPGVQSVGEASTGFNVRGGSSDQNLILLDDATIYNPSHFFGFFSAFNPDIVKDVQLYKSSIPERFGGRLASVLEVNNREGNKKEFTGSAGIGLITSRFNIEGPIDSNRTSFIFGGRTTYSNWMLKLLPDEYENSKASFTDLNLGITHQINDKNSVSVAGYFSTDKFKLNSDTTYGYTNVNASIRWKRTFNDKLIGTFSTGFDNYGYNIHSNVNPVNAYDLNFNIRQYNLKADFIYVLNNNHTLSFGMNNIYYKLRPGEFRPLGEESLVTPDIVATEQALENALYIGDKFDIGDNLSVNAGLRYSIFSFLGPKSVNRYAPGLPKTTSNLLETVDYGSNDFIKTYHGPEIRLSGRYNFSEDFSVKASYNTLRQYIHLLSNTTAIAPTDIWKLSDPNIKPQTGNQVSLGLYKNFKKNTIETSVEVYYKKLKDYLDYKSGASLVLNHHIETDVVNTVGKAYGVEFFIKKNAGKLNGWMSYAFSRTFLKFDDETVGEPINKGNYYPANFDKPHAFNFTGNYRFSHRYSASLNLTYSTGRPITLPIAKYVYEGGERVFYTDRNAYRIPDYFRTDFSFNIEGNHKVHQLTHNSWTLGVYNLTGRQNAYSVYFTNENGAINGYKLSIFAAAIPFINYNIRF